MSVGPFVYRVLCCWRPSVRDADGASIHADSAPLANSKPDAASWRKPTQPCVCSCNEQDDTAFNLNDRGLGPGAPPSTPISPCCDAFLASTLQAPARPTHTSGGSAAAPGLSGSASVGLCGQRSGQRLQTEGPQPTAPAWGYSSSRRVNMVAQARPELESLVSTIHGAGGCRSPSKCASPKPSTADLEGVARPSGITQSLATLDSLRLAVDTCEPPGLQSRPDKLCCSIRMSLTGAAAAAVRASEAGESVGCPSPGRTKTPTMPTTAVVPVPVAPFQSLAAAISNPTWLGQGSHGAVVKGLWHGGSIVAVKWMVADAVDSSACYQEAVVSKMLAHPNLVQCFDFQVCQLEANWEHEAELADAQQHEQQQLLTAHSGVLVNISPILSTRSRDLDLETSPAERCTLAAAKSIPADRSSPYLPHFGSRPPTCSGDSAADFLAGLGLPIVPAPPLVPPAASAAARSRSSGSPPNFPSAAAAAALAAASQQLPSPGLLGLPTRSSNAGAGALFFSSHRNPGGPCSLQQDSFDLGVGQHLDLGGIRSVSCADMLRQLGSGPGKYVVQIISEYCDEGTLHAAIRKRVFKAAGTRSRSWALRALLRTAREVALGMCHLHALNIIHGDLKPGNVMLKSSRADSRGFVAKVGDFGLSRLCLHGSAVDTSEWATVLYMAPEYLDNRLMKASDVWSFGVMLWHMFTGRQPYAEHHQAQVAVGVMMGTLHLEWPSSAPPALVRLAQACCHFDPPHRPGFKEVAVALAGLEAQERELHSRGKLRNQEAAMQRSTTYTALNQHQPGGRGYTSCDMGWQAHVGGGGSVGTNVGAGALAAACASGNAAGSPTLLVPDKRMTYAGGALDQAPLLSPFPMLAPLRSFVSGNSVPHQPPPPASAPSHQRAVSSMAPTHRASGDAGHGPGAEGSRFRSGIVPRASTSGAAAPPAAAESTAAAAGAACRPASLAAPPSVGQMLKALSESFNATELQDVWCASATASPCMLNNPSLEEIPRPPAPRQRSSLGDVAPQGGWSTDRRMLMWAAAAAAAGEPAAVRLLHALQQQQRPEDEQRQQQASATNACDEFQVQGGTDGSNQQPCAADSFCRHNNNNNNNTVTISCGASARASACCTPSASAGPSFCVGSTAQQATANGYCTQGSSMLSKSGGGSSSAFAGTGNCSTYTTPQSAVSGTSAAPFRWPMQGVGAVRAAAVRRGSAGPVLEHGFGFGNSDLSECDSPYACVGSVHPAIPDLVQQQQHQQHIKAPPPQPQQVPSFWLHGSASSRLRNISECGKEELEAA